MKKMNKKGVLTIFIIFMIASLIIVTIASVLSPMGVLFSTEMYGAGEGILLDANESISSITNTSVRTAIQGSIGSAVDNTENNIEVLTSLYKYGWILIVGILGLILFLFARSLVEFRRGSGLV